ncbi:MAG: chemotaxis protein CheW [Cyanophyceae cyanobacterium]
MSLSPLRLQRLTARQTEATHQLITFRLREDWFALPIRAVQKVVAGEEVCDRSGAAGRVATYQNQGLLIIDVARQIFKTPALPGTAATLPSQREPYFAILQISDGGIALPLDSAPVLRRVPLSALSPVSASYRAQGNFSCVSAMVIEERDRPPLLLLDPEKLMTA